MNEKNRMYVKAYMRFFFMNTCTIQKFVVPFATEFIVNEVL